MEGRRLLESLLSARGDDCNRLIEVNQVGNENLTANKSRNSNIVTSNTNDNNTNNSRQRRRISRAQSVAKRLDEHRPPGLFFVLTSNLAGFSSCEDVMANSPERHSGT
ncbi:unnamed protein product [Dracunculus medinensis]|uniref:Uncharacterized protein n=1 Tax=Dracunculus medinensis TaxID=318479 RepID=A0A0N4U3I4_DRAME|nr:unnamed protein product [Dracunculus medinensis]